ncbi:VOC family protein [Methylopila sp. 73B]|uniref:VOC family protein n=1 Tax=Methylopila sp. 73B TaxID=1120792 RepID=UPI0003A2B014|nr:VOC family protein [Methylopila sp. 73B]
MVDAASASPTLPDGLRLGVAELAVSDLGRSVAFYEDVVGLRTLDREARVATLGGTGGSAVLRLAETPGARPKPKDAPGLFHVAILLPERRDLAVVLARLARDRLRIGASDHLVSEALYLDDPDGNGLEIYRDRPKAEWPYRNGALRMATEPMAAQEVLAELSPGVDLDAAMPAGTVVGHVHLQVGDLAAARSFWIDAVGFALTTTYPGALFMSAGATTTTWPRTSGRRAGAGRRPRARPDCGRSRRSCRTQTRSTPSPPAWRRAAFAASATSAA